MKQNVKVGVTLLVLFCTTFAFTWCFADTVNAAGNTQEVIEINDGLVVAGEIVKYVAVLVFCVLGLFIASRTSKAEQNTKE